MEEGFSLIELMIVMAVAMLVVGFAVAWYQAESKRTARAELIETQAIEMSTLARALEQYLDDTPGLPASGGFDVSVADVEAAGYLPYLYLRPAEGLPPASPLGQVYVLRAIRQGDRYRGIVLPTGAPAEALLSRYGLKGSPDDMFAYATKVMRRMGAAHYATAGVLQPGATVTHPASGFSADYASLLDQPAGPGAVVGLAGHGEHSPFKDLIASVELGDGTGAGGSGDGAFEKRECYVESQGECRAGFSEEYAQTICDGWHDSLPGVGDRNATVSLGSETLTMERYVLQPTIGQIPDALRPSVVGSTEFTSRYAQISSFSGGEGLHESGSRSTTSHWVLGPIAPEVAMLSDSWSMDPRVSRSSDAQFEVDKILPGCGAPYEIATPVYRLTSGRFSLLSWVSASQAPAPEYLPGTQLLTASDPNNGLPAAGGAYWVERISTSTHSRSFVCRARALTSGTYSFPPLNSSAFPSSPIRHSENMVDHLRVTNSCGSHTMATVQNNGGNRSGPGRPFRLFEYLLPEHERPTFRYCCK